MRRLHVILALALLAGPVGCGWGRYGPSAQQIIPVPMAPAPIVPGPTELPSPQGVVIPGDAPMTLPPAGAGALPPVTIVPPDSSMPATLPPVTSSSTVSVPTVNRDFAWDQIVDVVDDYFEIDEEDRVKMIGDVLTEGRIDTFPLTGATIFEPWRRDSVNWHERWESTLQSIRRRAFVRVIPDESGLVVDVTVLKELEDVAKPLKASVGAATFRYDTSLERDTEFNPDPFRIPGDPARPVGPRAPTAGWIPLGRDIALEQVMLAKIQSRLGGVVHAPSPVVVSSPAISPEPVPAGVQPLPELLPPP